MTKRVHNFNAGPSVLPMSVLETAQSELLDYKGCGMSVMELSHRSKEFESIIQTAEADLRELMGIPATGRKATWGEIGVLRFSDGKIVESFYNVDMLALFQGLGIGGDNSAKG